MSRLQHRSHFYAGNAFNRLSERRNDSAWLQQQLSNGAARMLPLWQGRNLIVDSNIAPHIALLEQHTLPTQVTTEQLILLGEFHGQVCFALELFGDIAPAVHESAEFHDLRRVGGLLNRDEAALLGYGRALLTWRDKHRYCGRCGSSNVSTHAGHVLECSSTTCKQQQFPRLDPAVIVLVTDGERVLLGRQARFPAGHYSTIAGFVEWAESIEEAVAREVREETGVLVDEVEYHSSQPWPFPSSLMLGFIAHATTTAITLADQELEDARWFTRADIANGALRLPPPQSISFALIEYWYNSGSTQPLRHAATATESFSQLFK